MAVLAYPFAWVARAIGSHSFGGLATVPDSARVVLIPELCRAIPPPSSKLRRMRRCFHQLMDRTRFLLLTHILLHYPSVILYGFVDTVDILLQNCCHCYRHRHLRCRQCRLRCRCRHRSLLPLSSPLSLSPVSVVAAQQWRRSDGQRRWWRSDGDGDAAMAMGRRRPHQRHRPSPPCPTTIARPLSPRHLVRDLDLVVAPRPPSSVATAATAVFLLSPHLPHFLIVVSIVPPPTCDSDVVVKARCTSLPRAWPAGRSHPIPTPALRGAPPPT